MANTQSRYCAYRRKDTKKFILTINPASGLPDRICKEWYRVTYYKLPNELSRYREPKTQTEANIAAEELINLLKEQLSIVRPKFNETTVGEWLARFTSPESNPRSEQLNSEGTPYSPDTLYGYKIYFNLYLKDDSYLRNKMSEITEADTRSFISRVGLKKNKKE